MLAQSADGCVTRMESQAARAYMHEIECVERLDLNSLMRKAVVLTAAQNFTH